MNFSHSLLYTKLDEYMYPKYRNYLPINSVVWVPTHYCAQPGEGMPCFWNHPGM